LYDVFLTVFTHFVTLSHEHLSGASLVNLDQERGSSTLPMVSVWVMMRTLL